MVLALLVIYLDSARACDRSLCTLEDFAQMSFLTSPASTHDSCAVLSQAVWGSSHCLCSMEGALLVGADLAWLENLSVGRLSRLVQTVRLMVVEDD